MRDASAHAPEHRPLLWVDAVKGLAIILVVFGHTWRGSAGAGLFDGAPEGLFLAVDTRIYAFHMPLFFMLSGFFLLSSLHRSDGAGFFRSRMIRLVWPMLLWSYVFTLSKIAAGPLANTPVILSWELLQPIPGKWQFWFLWALFVLHMTVLALRPLLLDARTTRITLWALFALGLTIALTGLPKPVHYWTSEAAYALPSLVAGMLMATYGLLRRPPLLVGLAGLVGAVVLIALTPMVPTHPFPYIVLSLAICLSLVTGLCWVAPHLSGLTQALAYFGQASMIIFVSHTLFAAPVRIALIKLGVSDLPTHIVIGTVVGLLAPMALKHLIDRSGKQALFAV